MKKPYFIFLIFFLTLLAVINIFGLIARSNTNTAPIVPTASEQILINKACTSWQHGKNLVGFKSDAGWDDGYRYGGQVWADIVTAEIPFRFEKLEKKNPAYSPLVRQAQEISEWHMYTTSSNIEIKFSELELFCKKYDKTTDEEYYKDYCQRLGEDAIYLSTACRKSEDN